MIQKFEGHLYLNLETMRRNGERVPTPVWFVRDGERLYVRTIAGSGKVKRIRNYPDVRVAPCAVDGRLLGDWLPARAVESTDEVIAARVAALLREKYGAQVAEFERRAREAGQRYTILQIELV